MNQSAALISEAYREQQRVMHDTYDGYGMASVHYAPMVARVMNGQKVSELLDYGAGKLRLIKTLSERRLVQHAFTYRAYEPSNPEHAKAPEPAEMVACIDVLEHIEPDLIDNVLDDLQRLTKKIGFFTVATVPAMKTLDDGRNAHLIIEPTAWWLPKFLDRFELHTFQLTNDGFVVLVTGKDYGAR